jgi:RNA-binding protein
MDLTGQQRRYLRSLANRLGVTVRVGKEGVSDAVLAELGHEFEHRELLKLSVNSNCESSAKELAHDLARRAGAHWVQTLGRTVVLYRAGDPPEIKLP